MHTHVSEQGGTQGKGWAVRSIIGPPMPLALTSAAVILLGEGSTSRKLRVFRVGRIPNTSLRYIDDGAAPRYNTASSTTLTGTLVNWNHPADTLSCGIYTVLFCRVCFQGFKGMITR